MLYFLPEYILLLKQHFVCVCACTPQDEQTTLCVDEANENPNK